MDCAYVYAGLAGTKNGTWRFVAQRMMEYDGNYWVYA